MEQSTCAEPDCGNDAAARNLCRMHYGKHHRAGTLPEWDRAHRRTARLSNVDLTARTADCIIHGPASRLRVRPQIGDTPYFACRACDRGGRPSDRNRVNWKRGPSKPRRFRAALEGLGQTTCQICGAGDDLGVDHDHGCHPPGSVCRECVRGLLCRGCNVALGFMRDDPDLLERAAEYLRKDLRPMLG